MNISLSGKAAIVTGAGSGIGLATTRQFLESGAQVVAVDRRSDLQSAFTACTPEQLARLAIVIGDVAVEATAKEFAAAALERFGRLDVLVNNAAVNVVKPIHEHTPEEWDFVMNTNVKALFLASRHVVPVMIKKGGGVILNAGSISGVVGIPTQGAYAPSKGAVHQMTRQMAIEYGRYNIRVNAVCCGTINTPLVQASAEASGDAEGYWKMLRDGHPIGRIAEPEEVAGFYTYLASDLASFITGATLMFDGGFTAI